MPHSIFCHYLTRLTQVTAICWAVERWSESMLCWDFWRKSLYFGQVLMCNLVFYHRQCPRIQLFHCLINCCMEEILIGFHLLSFLINFSNYISFFSFLNFILVVNYPFLCFKSLFSLKCCKASWIVNFCHKIWLYLTCKNCINDKFYLYNSILIFLSRIQTNALFLCH